MFDIAERVVGPYEPFGINLLRFHFRFHRLGVRMAAVDCKQPSDIVPSSHVQIVERPYLVFRASEGALILKATTSSFPPSAEF
jgi:hypothetical protein